MTKQQVVRFTETDKTCIRLHIIGHIDLPEQMWEYIEDYGKMCYNAGKRVGQQNKKRKRIK